MTKFLYSLLMLGGILISAVAQILLKKSSGREYESKIKEYLNPFVIISYSIFFIATFCSIFAYKEVPLSLGPILGAMEYIFVAVLSRVILKEKVSVKKAIGLAIIVAGVIISAL